MPLFRLFLAFAALLAAVLLSWAATRPATAQIDLSGTWSVQFSGSVNVTCDPAYIKQHGTPIFMVLPCLPWGGIVGTIDKGTGNLTGSSTYLCKGFVEATFTMSGSAAHDGNTISGTWNTVCLSTLSGTFGGQRVGPPVLTIVAPTATLTVVPPSATPTATATNIVTRTTTAVLQQTGTPTPGVTPPSLGGAADFPNLPANSGNGGIVMAFAAAAAALGLGGTLLWSRRRFFS